MKKKIIVCVGLALSSVAPMRAGWLDTVKANVGKYATGVQVQANVCKNATQNAIAGTPVEDAANYIHETATHIAKNGLTNQQMAAASIIGAYGLHKVRDAHFTGYNPCNMRNVLALGSAALAGYLGRDTACDTSLLATIAFVGTKSILDYICKRSNNQLVLAQNENSHSIRGLGEKSKYYSNISIHVTGNGNINISGEGFQCECNAVEFQFIMQRSSIPQNKKEEILSTICNGGTGEFTFSSYVTFVSNP